MAVVSSMAISIAWASNPSSPMVIMTASPPGVFVDRSTFELACTAQLNPWAWPDI